MYLLFLAGLILAAQARAAQGAGMLLTRQLARAAVGASLGVSLLGPLQLPLQPPAFSVPAVYAAEEGAEEAGAVVTGGITKVALFTRKSSDVQAYSDVGRGFRLLRPFGFNEFEGAGGGYLVKFSSLFDVDENVVVGSAPATAGKTSITQYGELQQLGEKLATKRGGKLISATARETEGIVFYVFQFQNPLDPALPRPGSKSLKPEALIELYELCVSKGRLWSVQATTNDKLFPKREATLRAALDSFVPRL